MQIIDIEPHEQKKIDVITRNFPDELVYENEGEAVTWISETTAEEFTGSQFEKKLSAAKAVGKVILVRGISIPNAPPTPARYQPTEHAEIYPFDIAHIAVASLVGSPYATKHLRGSRIISDIFPKDQYGAKHDSAFGSNKPFDFHADGALHPDTKPEYFSFQCVRNVEQIPTTVSWVEQDDLTNDQFQKLQEPVFTLFYENREAGAHKVSGLPIMYFSRDGSLRYNYYGKTKVTVECEQDKVYFDALKAFEEALIKNSIDVLLSSGEIMIVDNKSALHARSSFEAAEAQVNRRWMRRIYIAADDVKQESIANTPSRILTSNVDRGWYI